MTDLHEIWNDGKSKLSGEQIVAYFAGKLNADEKHEVERLLSEEGMESDALEGLQNISPGNTLNSVNRLNRKLRHLTQKKRRHTTFADQKWTWAAILIILLLCILGYWVLSTINK